MKKVLASLALAVSALTLSAAAQANVVGTTITFDPIDTSTLYFPPLLVYGDEFYTPGINGRTMWFDPASNSSIGGPGDFVGSIVTGDCSDPDASLQCPANNATNYVSLLDDAFLAFGSVEAHFTFSVQSLSASFIGSGGQLPSTPGYVALQGYRASDGLTLTAYYALTGLDADGHLNFGTIDTGAFGDYEFDVVYAYGYACTDSTCSSFSTNKAQFALDDIAIEHVPEPASLALVGIAGLALVGARRRRAA
jgi:hypothetical protein